jgi:hypothetical protein
MISKSNPENSDQEMVITAAEEVVTMTIEVSLESSEEEAIVSLTEKEVVEEEEAIENLDHSIPPKNPKVLTDLALVSKSSEAIVE